MIDTVPHSSARRDRRARRTSRRVLAAGAVVATALLVGCSAGGEEPSPGDPVAAQPTPEAGPTSAASRTGSPPEFHGERALAVQPGRRVFVQPSCTPDDDGLRLCWGETGNPIERDGSPAPVTLTDAEMRLDDLGLEWSVRLTFAEADALGRAAGSAAGADGDGRVLLLRDGDLVRLLPAAAVTGRVVTLTGLEKDDAWDLVELAGGL